jgi:hypothetical protein
VRCICQPGLLCSADVRTLLLLLLLLSLLLLLLLLLKLRYPMSYLQC